MQKILIATKNQGKIVEITHEMDNLDFEFVSLNDVGLQDVELKEDYATTWENAVKKAKFFADKSGLMTIAEDSGLFIDYLNGEPGVATKRAAATPKERVKRIINLLKGVQKSKRGAYFETS